MNYSSEENTMSNCIGCGVKLQQENINELGYTRNSESKLCERCFKIRNYGEYKKTNTKNNRYVS